MSGSKSHHGPVTKGETLASILHALSLQCLQYNEYLCHLEIFQSKLLGHTTSIGRALSLPPALIPNAACIYILSHTYAHTVSHPCAHTHVRTHTHTHVRAHTRMCPRHSSCCSALSTSVFLRQCLKACCFNDCPSGVAAHTLLMPVQGRGPHM